MGGLSTRINQSPETQLDHINAQRERSRHRRRARDATVSANPDVASLPQPLAVHLLSFLPGEDIAACAQVCTSWHKLASTKSLWKEAAINEFGDAPPALLRARTFFVNKREQQIQDAANAAAVAEERRERIRRFAERGDYAWFKNSMACCGSIIMDAFIPGLLMLQVIFLALAVDGTVDLTWSEALWPTWVFDVYILCNIVASLMYFNGYEYIIEEDERVGLYITALKELWLGRRVLFGLLLHIGSLGFVAFTIMACVKLEDPEWDVSWMELMVPLALPVLSLVTFGRGVLGDMDNGYMDGEDSALYGYLFGWVHSPLLVFTSVILMAHNADALIDGDDVAVEWPVAFVPLWLLDGLFFIIPCVLCALGMNDFDIDATVAFAGMIINLVLMAPFVVFQGLLCARLDGANSLDAMIICVPLLVSAGLLTLVSGCWGLGELI